MALTPVANKTRLSIPQLRELLDGRIPAAAAIQIGALVPVVQSFIDGRASPDMAGRLGLSVNGLEALIEDLSRDGRIGFLLGLLWSDRP